MTKVKSTKGKNAFCLKLTKEIHLLTEVIMVLPTTTIFPEYPNHRSVDMIEYDKRWTKNWALIKLMHQTVSVVTPNLFRPVLHHLESVTEKKNVTLIFDLDLDMTFTSWVLSKATCMPNMSIVT